MVVSIYFKTFLLMFSFAFPYLIEISFISEQKEYDPPLGV